MIKLADYSTEKALPAEMRTAERIALSYAFDVQKKKFLEHIQDVYIWADLEKVADNKLDFLAVENRVLFYEPDASPEMKRNLIRNFMHWHMKLGTRQALEEMISMLYEETKIEEWHEYGGEPYHFRIATTAPITEDGYGTFRKQIRMIKNARSRIDQIRTMRKVYENIYSGAAASGYSKGLFIQDGYAVDRQAAQTTYIGALRIFYSKNPFVRDGYSINRRTAQKAYIGCASACYDKNLFIQDGYSIQNRITQKAYTGVATIYYSKNPPVWDGYAIHRQTGHKFFTGAAYYSICQPQEVLADYKVKRQVIHTVYAGTAGNGLFRQAAAAENEGQEI